jgi:hypothetical protein
MKAGAGRPDRWDSSPHELRRKKAKRRAERAYVTIKGRLHGARYLDIFLTHKSLPESID